MSHGAVGDEEIEVNMIPMIDIVIQLISFFLILFNMDKGNIDEQVRLPIAALAIPNSDAAEEPLVLNINRDGECSFMGERHDVESPEFKVLLSREAALARNAKGDVEGKSSLGITLIIRADKEANFGKIQRMMQTCRSLGFVKYSLRAHPTVGGL